MALLSVAPSTKSVMAPTSARSISRERYPAKSCFPNVTSRPRDRRGQVRVAPVPRREPSTVPTPDPGRPLDGQQRLRRRECTPQPVAAPLAPSTLGAEGAAIQRATITQVRRLAACRRQRTYASPKTAG